jgi:hypothetical protein
MHTDFGLDAVEQRATRVSLSVTAASRGLEVPTSGFHAKAGHTPSPLAQADARLGVSLFPHADRIAVDLLDVREGAHGLSMRDVPRAAWWLSSRG